MMDLPGGDAPLDTAYGTEAIILHTDTTYFFNPMKLQLFNCCEQATHGGETILSDGFYAANQLAFKDPNAFDILRETCVSTVCYERQNIFRAAHPVINLDLYGNLRMVRAYVFSNGTS